MPSQLHPQFRENDTNNAELETDLDEANRRGLRASTSSRPE